ncbi:SpoIIIAH-like family protein [Cohnella sp.]|uniref:SpoIIIAH-like family protein n=1 Tax=Cohnella sp. TaxID=1883426 RepID=UPI003568A817
MNNKRQTIWLVSMLSLMVILSAYYLFTEDVAPTDNASSKEQSELVDAGKVSTPNPEGVVVTEVEQITEGITGSETDGALGETAPEVTAENKETAGVSPEDEDVLKEMANLEGSKMLDQTQRERMEAISKKAEELNAIIANTKVSQEEVSKAAEELYRLEDTDLRITSLQEKLLQDFDNAVVSEEDTNFKVIVLSDKLEKKQAVGIIDLATKELNITPDRVTVQYVN